MDPPQLIQNFFAQLVALECDIDVELKKSEELELLKAKILSSLEAVPVTSEVYKNQHIPRVFAALGQFETNDYLAALTERTGLTKQTVEQTLQDMLKLELIAWNSENQTYEIKKSNLVFEDEEERQSHFRNYYLYALDQLAQTAKDQYTRDDQLFLSSCVLIKREKFPQLKRDFIQLLNQYVENIEESSGDQVINLTLGMGAHKASLSNLFSE